MQASFLSSPTLLIGELKQISGYLIMYRLAEGRAWRKDTLEMLPTATRYQTKETLQAATLTNLSTFQVTYTTSQRESLPTDSSSMHESGFGLETGSRVGY